MRLFFVFDGQPPHLKKAEVEKRREIREKFEEEYQKAVIAGNYREAMSKAVMTGRLTGEGIGDAKRLLDARAREERSFSRERVETVISRMRKARSQRSLRDWFGGV
jgi:5'-3' exonuclease